MSPHDTAITLESVLHNSSTDLFQNLAAFMKQTHCAENLTFWRAVEHYRTLHHRHTSREEQHDACQTILTRHIEPDSDQEINIPCDMRQAILDQVDAGDYRPAVFDPAMAAVVELMRSNAFLPWVTAYYPDRLSKLSLTPTRSSMPSSMSFPDRWQLHKLIKSPRPSYSSFRSVEPEVDRRRTLTFDSALERLKKGLGFNDLNAHSRRWSVWRKAKST